jgi:O-antigen/teichoic acid export membrane protein
VSSPDASLIEESAADLVGSSEAGPVALRGSAMLGASYAGSIALSLISVPLLIRHLGISRFGRYTTVVAIVTIVNGLSDAGLFNIALREWSTRTGAARAELMRSLLGVRLQLSAIGVVVGVAFAAAAGYDHVLVIGTLVAGLGMVLQALTNILAAPLQGELRFGWVAAIDVARQVVSVALIVVLVLVGAGLTPFFAVTIPAGLVTAAFVAVLVRRDVPLRPRFRGGEWWPLVRDTLPYAAAIAVNTLYFRVTIVVMSLAAVARQTGYFATSFRVTEVLIGVPALAVGAAFPILSRAARDDRDRLKHATERIIELSIIAGVALLLAVVLSAPFIIEVLAGASGKPATAVLQIQGLALVATFLSMATGFVLLSTRRHTALLVANGGALLANVVLTLILVPVWQARGAAIAAVVAESCLALGQLTLVLRDGSGRVNVAALPAIAAAGLVGASPLLIDGLHPILRAALGVGLYVVVLAILGRFPPEVSHALDRRRGGQPIR